MLQADNSVKIWRNLSISDPETDLHNIKAHTKFHENPLMFSQVIILKWKTDGWQLMDRQMDGQTHRCPRWNHNTLPLLCGEVFRIFGLYECYLSYHLLAWKFPCNAIWAPVAFHVSPFPGFIAIVLAGGVKLLILILNKKQKKKKKKKIIMK